MEKEELRSVLLADPRLCTKCRLCEKLCPTYAIIFDNKGTLVFRTERCIACYGCVVICPKKALSLEVQAPEVDLDKLCQEKSSRSLINFIHRE
ncbi:MAG: hypothetical protein DRO12_00260 [Thermoprotei archaeon]|nr:MAG: hypothetical protein DRO12_00260 [Thermoprotei archaeon]